MRKFTLLVNGKDVDTGIYDYFPYTDKTLLDFRRTLKLIRDYKEGKTSPDAEKYLYAQYCIGDDTTNLKAVESAFHAFQEFRKFPLSTRRKIFHDMYVLLTAHKEDLIQLLIVEGHPRKLAEWEFEGMRIGSSPDTIDFYCKQIQKEVGRYGKEILYWARRPDGVVCVSPPGNASASNSYNAILAFLTGNTLVIKPPLRAPVATIFLWKEVVNKALLQNGAPTGTLNIVLGNSKVIMEEWLASPHVNDIIFFGESKNGLEIGNEIFKAGKKPILELSGNDIVSVWKDADIEKATDSLMDAFLGSTQICMVPKLSLVHEDIFDAFAARLIEKVKGIKAALPTDPETPLSPVAKIKEFSEHLHDALAKGAVVLYGGKRLNHLNQQHPCGVFIQPTLIKIEDYDAALTLRCVKEEIFFPLLPLIKISGTDEQIFDKMINFVNCHGYGLRASLWIKSATYLRKFAKELDNSGILRINSRHVGFSYYLSTHGGTRKSGGPFGEMNYFWHKTSHLQGVSRVVK